VFIMIVSRQCICYAGYDDDTWCILGSYHSFSVKKGRLNMRLFDKIPDIDDCSPDPCDHGTCLDQINGFQCICDTGYEDDTCSTSKLHPSVICKTKNYYFFI
jgi:hypothetical protein